MSWDRKFADPIELPGKRLITLRDAAEFTKLPKAEYDTPNGRPLWRRFFWSWKIAGRRCSPASVS